MSGNQVGAVIGGVVGYIYGGPAGAQFGMAIGAAVGSSSEPRDCPLPSISQSADFEFDPHQLGSGEKP